eukprot:191614-Chlamydomonas_euryale.AAC.1
MVWKKAPEAPADAPRAELSPPTPTTPLRDVKTADRLLSVRPTLVGQGHSGRARSTVVGQGHSGRARSTVVGQGRFW